ncbi:MAG: murein biosynthesis integral membrane protein MurJ [Scytonematopsis contorta HA4267-MV1]|jgi:putative peptidoglycan lipid II flippase|nr:murein biosynthesis integral membrane protein MurJ [Scytonematopsis contorta HA4267-MV1]
MINLPLKAINEIWKKYTKGSVNRQIFGAAIVVGLLTVFVKLASVSKELVLAWKFGTGDELDAFYIAFVVPSLIINVVAGSFQSSLIPTYIEVREQEGKKAAQKLFSGVSVLVLGLSVVATVLIIVTAPIYLPYIAGGFDKEKLDLTFYLLCAMAPLVVINGIGIIWGAVLNAGESFALAALTPILIPGITIIMLLGFEYLRTFNLVIGLIGGAVVEIIFLGAALQKRGNLLLPKWRGLSPHLKQVIKQYFPAVGGAVLMSSTNLVDQGMAAMLAPGSVAALNYGNKVPSLLVTFCTTALSTAVIPYFSKMVAYKDWVGVRRTIKRYMWLIFLATIPLAIFLIIFSEAIVRFLFQRGSFTVDDTQLVTQVQICYILQIPFYLGCTLLVRLASSLKSNHILMYAAAINLVTNICLNYIFMKILGLAGIALSTSFVYLVAFVFLLIYIIYFIKEKDEIGC